VERRQGGGHGHYKLGQANEENGGTKREKGNPEKNNKTAVMSKKRDHMTLSDLCRDPIFTTDRKREREWLGEWVQKGPRNLASFWKDRRETPTVSRGQLEEG